MSAPIKGIKGTDAKAMLQDLKSNRRLQIALAALAVMVWYLWPASTPSAVPKGAQARRAAD
ncbi:MAG: hypothetical protein HGA66_18785, partial [Holophaga sp.]|nr:hypothetical protein [Holophaga sp.]